MVQIIRAIPIMTSDIQDGFEISATSGVSRYRAFDGLYDDGENTSIYRSSVSPSLPEYLSITFPEKRLIGRYILHLGYYHTLYSNMETWDFEGLINGVWTILHSGENPTQESATLTFDFNPVEVEGVRIKCKTQHGTNSWGVDELEVYEFIFDNKILILNDGSHKKWAGSWQVVNTSTEQSFIDNGMEASDIEAIPESAWQELQGVVSLSYYTDNPSTESITIETETKPYSIYDEFGDTMDVLYYTDDPDKEEAELEITANYSPLDEIEGDYEVVTWTDEEDAERILTMDALPVPQFIKQVNPISMENDISNLVSTESGESNKKYLLSPNKTRWMAWNGASWVVANEQNQSMTVEELSLITIEQWSTWVGDEMYLGIYVDEHTIIDSIAYTDAIAKESTRISDAKLYILNTVSTIDVSFAGSTITGTIDDEDEGKVQYRVILNGENYYPTDGSFTPLLASPLDINLVLSNKDYKIDENNTLRVEFKDYWGTVDYWQQNFIGAYSGILFTDPIGEYYSTDVGEVLKHLDFGDIYAGQTTIAHEVILKNTYGYAINNIRLYTKSGTFPNGMKAQFGTSMSSFEAAEELDMKTTLEDGEEVPFYIRLSTQLGVTPPTMSEFDIVVVADRV